MPALPTTGEIRFSAIGTEFSDPYSETDSTKTIRLSHYYTNIPSVGGNDGIDTTHLATDANPPVQDPFPMSFNPFSLELFRGKERFIEDSGDNEEPAPTDAQSTVIDWKGGGGSSSLEWLDGVKIAVKDRTTREHATERLGPIDELNRGKVKGQDDRRSVKIHARTTDRLIITGVIRQNGSYPYDNRRITVYLKKPTTGWEDYGSSGWQEGSKTHIVEIATPSVGVYAIIVAGYYSNADSWGSVKKYTLEIW
jgi:hypothetical protein